MKYRELTDPIIGAAVEVHCHLGPGLLESVYEECLCHEFELRHIAYERQVQLGVHYKGLHLPQGHRVDLVVHRTVVVELKSVETILPVHKAQLLSYLRLGSWPVGLLINFNEAILKDGLRRLTLDFGPP